MKKQAFVVYIFFLFLSLSFSFLIKTLLPTKGWGGGNPWAWIFHHTRKGIKRSITDVEIEFLMVFLIFIHFIVSFFFFFFVSSLIDIILEALQNFSIFWLRILLPQRNLHVLSFPFPLSPTHLIPSPLFLSSFSQPLKPPRLPEYPLYRPLQSLCCPISLRNHS